MSHMRFVEANLLSMNRSTSWPSSSLKYLRGPMSATFSRVHDVFKTYSATVRPVDVVVSIVY